MNFKEDLGKALGLRTYKLRLVQELKPLDLLKCRDFGEWGQNKIAMDQGVKIKILFSDYKYTQINHRI